MSKRKGIILAGGKGTRLHPLTISVSKQLMPIYDKPMIYYPLAVLMLAGIDEILIICTPEDLYLFEKLLKDGFQWGIQISYAKQAKPEGIAQAYIIAEDFLDGNHSALILGDNLFYGNSFSNALKAASCDLSGATIFAYHVNDPKSYGVVEFDDANKVVSIEEKPQKPKSHYAIPGLYFYDEQAPSFAKSIQPSARGELEILDIHLCYLKQAELKVKVLERGVAWLDTGTHNNLIEAGRFVQIIEKRQNFKIACLEEIALRNNWISKESVKILIESAPKSSYYDYLKTVMELIS